MTLAFGGRLVSEFQLGIGVGVVLSAVAVWVVVVAAISMVRSKVGEP